MSIALASIAFTIYYDEELRTYGILNDIIKRLKIIYIPKCLQDSDFSSVLYER